MLYTPLTKKAMKLCFEAHEGQVDRSGVPYVNHPLHLAEQMLYEDETCVALLHDVIEDSRVSEGDLHSIGMSERAIDAIRLLTHDKEVPYLDYIRSIKEARDFDEVRAHDWKHPEHISQYPTSATIAYKVKVADLRHNSQLARLNEVGERDIERLRKYMEARVILGDMTYSVDTPLGPFRVEVNGSPYPFTVEDCTRQAFAFYEEVIDPAEEEREPYRGRPDKVLELEVDVLPLQVGDVIAPVFDFGCSITGWGSGERIYYRTYAKDGFSMGVGFYDDEHDEYTPKDYDPHAFEAWGWGGPRNPESDEYHIVSSPVDHRFYAHAHTILFRLAWNEGVDEESSAIVSWVAGF